MRKRILSILLVVVMCFTMMPTTTFAAESAEHEQATEISEAVCTCGTDDESIHATNCPAYVAPENPECNCVESCAEGAPNVWCDICGFDVVACQGEDTAVVYASVTSLTFNFITIVEGGEVKTTSGEGWNYDSTSNTLYITADVTGAATTSDTVLKSVGGGLNINVASGTTLTLNADRIAVRLGGDSTISGGGTVALTGGETQAPLWVEGSLGISNVALTVTSKGDWAVRSYGAITLENVDAQFTGTVEPANGATYYPVSILGNSVISINQGKLKASDLTLSDSSHLKVSGSGTWLISSLNSMLPIPVNGGYYRTSADGTFAVDSDDVTLDAGDDKYFEYVGANHVGETKQNDDGATHSKSCTCSLAAVVETGACEGGEAACSAKAVCATCNTEYGELAAHSTSAEDDKAATCTAKAYCSVCEGEYGEVNPGNHAGTSYTDGFRNCCGESEPATGSGTEDAPYQISNTGQLLWFAQQVNSGNTAISGKLMNNIDLSGVTYTPIGTTAYPYVGTFDGQGFRIKNMAIDTTDTYQGLFAAVSGGVHIKNVIIDASCSINAGSYSAALVGGSTGSGSVIIENCGNEATVNAGQNASGIFGVNMNSSATVTIRNCYNTGNITASKEGGGISGWIGDEGSSVTNCWSSGVVTGGDSFARGRSAVTYTNCYHLDSLTASASTGINTFTAEELENGALAYKLGVLWGQTIGTNNHPVLNGKVVYYGYISCGTDAVMVYSNNSSASEEKPAHTWNTEGVCTVCGEQAVAQLTAASFDSDDIVSYYTDLQTAVDAAENQSGSTLTLLDNVTLTNGTSIAIGGGTFTFDLAGHTITFAEQADNVAIKVSAGDIIFTDSGDSGSVVVPGTYTNSRAMVISGGMVTIDGGSYTARNAIDTSEGTTLAVKDGTITASSTSGIGISSSGTLNIYGGSIHTNSKNGYGCAISLSGSCTATITGGVFTSSDTDTYDTSHLFRYSGGNLDLTNYANLDGLTFSSGSSSTTDVTNVKLPDGYVFLDKAGNQTMTVTATSLADRILTIRSLVSLSNVTISFAAAEGGGTMESESISSGEPYTLPENGFTAPEGMKFKAWKVGDDTTEYQPGAEISVTTDTVITAVWEDITYKITYAAGEGSGTMDSGTAIWGTAFTLPNCTFTAPSAGYEFKAWLIGGAEYTAGETYTFTEDTTVTAVWQIATSGQALVIDKDGVILGRYSSVTAAVTVAEANNGSTLKLMEAVTLDSPIYIESGTFTVDINGQSVTVSNSVFNVSGTAAITFTDTADSKGLVTSNSTGLSAAIRVYGGTAVIQNGVYAGPSSVLVTSGGTATINGGTFNNKLYNDGGTLTVNDTTAQDVTIENSTVAVDTIVSGGAITEVSFNGGTLSFKNHPNPAGIEVYYNASVTEIPLPTGYYFTDENGTVTTAFATGKTYTIRASEGLNTVSFDANGGTGTMASIVMEQGDYTLPACGFTAPEHYIFRTWQIGDDEYAPGKNITVLLHQPEGQYRHQLLYAPVRRGSGRRDRLYAVHYGRRRSHSDPRQRRRRDPVQRRDLLCVLLRRQRKGDDRRCYQPVLLRGWLYRCAYLQRSDLRQPHPCKLRR